MPTFAAGHGAAWLKAITSPQISQQDPPASSKSRRKSNPPLAPLARSSPPTRPHNARQPPCHRQIPIDRTTRSAAPNPPAVSSPEASPTPAARANGNNLQQRVSENPSQLQKSEASLGMSAAGGQADVNRRKADIATRMSHTGGTTEVSRERWRVRS